MLRKAEHSKIVQVKNFYELKETRDIKKLNRLELQKKPQVIWKVMRAEKITTIVGTEK